MSRVVKSSNGLLCTIVILLSVVQNVSCVARSAQVSTAPMVGPVEDGVSEDLLVTPTGVGPWVLGMSPTQVFIQPECKPFLPARVTGGLECPNFDTPFGERTISFEFSGEDLSKIQVRLYQGNNPEEWAGTLWRSIEIVSEAHQVVLDDLILSSLGVGAMDDQGGFVGRVTELAGAGLPLSFSFVIDPHLSQRRWLSAVFNPRGVASVYLFVGEE